jgi:glycosyltransferase involved in cell wall biosynthesis
MSALDEIGHEALLWLLGSVSALYRLPFDPSLVAQQFPPPHNLATLHEAARSLGLKTGHANIKGVDWQKLPLPAVAFLLAVPVAAGGEGEGKPAEVESASTEQPAPRPQPRIPVLVLKTDGRKLLYFRAGSQKPETITVEAAAQQFGPELILIAKGGNAEGLHPDPQAAFTTPGGLTLRAGDPVITYVARNLEAYRGFHIFMRALERIQKQHKTCHALIVGGDDVSYGRRPGDAPN